jgi:hypothetical protein
LEPWEELRNIGNAREFNVPALRAAKPVTKSRRVVTNLVPPKVTALTPEVVCALLAVCKEYAVASEQAR